MVEKIIDDCSFISEPCVDCVMVDRRKRMVSVVIPSESLDCIVVGYRRKRVSSSFSCGVWAM